MKTRGQKRLLEITYGMLAEWTGMHEGSIRNAVHQGRLDPSNIGGLMRWVNERRVRKGLPLIGDPDGPIPDIDDPSAPANPTIETNSRQSTPNQDNQPTSPTAPSHPPSCRCSSCYQASKVKRA